jgi:hypothetical protein
MKPHHNVESENTEATMSAKALYTEFQNDEREAEKMDGKGDRDQGKISSVSENDNYISVILGVTADGGVNCSMLKKDLSPGYAFKIGEDLTIKGKCTGFLMDVNLVDCVIKKN